MDAEFLELARAATGALQAMAHPETRWIEVVQTLSSVVGLGCIVWGLFSMKAAGKRRDREIDVLAENMRESTRVVGQALERQGEAMTQAFTQQGEALRQQGKALETLIERTAPR